MGNLLKISLGFLFNFWMIPLQNAAKTLILLDRSQPSHADPVLLLPELRDLLSQRQLCQAPTLPWGEPHEHRPFHHDLLPRSQLGHPCRDEVGWYVAVKLPGHAEGWPGFTCCSWLAPLHTLHVAGNFYSALMWQGQHLQPRKAIGTGLPDSSGNAPPNGNVPSINGNVAVHDIWAGAHTCT